ncbi:phosphate signaling complex protein PhoU [Sulfuriflexus mobilis]|uniref:phosphate signaling complex protein PhoU n=1 Tax=Sulfuriflexus mobilis TaxID=1811807 RepID=UPI000F84D0ED|nr:phosphate signaling complex protein PhoU [Sulfuriflexus mobilis]
MEKNDLGKHISQQFNSELEDVRNRVLTMGGLVEQQLNDALQALVDGNMELGEQVIGRDYLVNEMEVSIDEECTQIIARRQPAASDLRLIMAVIKTITDLERIGDEAERFAKMMLRHSGEDKSSSLTGSIENMGEQVKQMLHGALDAFARMDPAAATEVWLKDSKIDTQYESIMRQLITYMMEDPRSIPWSLDVMWSARALERIGDRSSNICEYVIYLVKGKDVRHISAEQF